MADPTDSVVEGLGRRERLVTALVSQNPETGTEKTLNKGVESPQREPGGRRRNVLRCDILVEEEESDTKGHDISGNVVETSCSGSLEAVGRYGISYVLNCVVRNLELIAITVNKSSALILEQFLVVGAH